MPAARFASSDSPSAKSSAAILVQLLWIYYVLQIVFGIGISSLGAILIGLSVHGVFHFRGLSRRHPGGAAGASRGRAGPRPDLVSKLSSRRTAAGHSYDAAAACVKFPPTHQVLFARRGHF